MKNIISFDPFFGDRDFDFFGCPVPGHGHPPFHEMKPFKNDVIEYNDRVEIKAELPGYSKEDISISIDDHRLIVKATKKDEKEDMEDGKIIHKEIYSGSISRSYSIGKGLDENSIKAEFKDGILKLTILKYKEEPETSRKINIE